MSFEFIFGILGDTVTISLATMMFFWFCGAGKEEEGAENFKLELLILLVSKTSSWVSIPVGLYKLFTGPKEIEDRKNSPVPNKIGIVRLMWWGLGLELFGLISSLLDILK